MTLGPARAGRLKAGEHTLSAATLFKADIRSIEIRLHAVKFSLQGRYTAGNGKTHPPAFKKRRLRAACKMPRFFCASKCGVKRAILNRQRGNPCRIGSVKRGPQTLPNSSCPWPEFGGYEEGSNMTTVPTFAKRRNVNSSIIDSICTKCFVTVASAGSEEELVAYEEKHVCDPYGEFSSTRFNPESRRPRGVTRQPPNTQAPR